MKNKVGRPAGWTKLDEPKIYRLSLKVSKTAKKWVESLGRGGLIEKIENLARKK